jgi:hypothetical protein
VGRVRSGFEQRNEKKITIAWADGVHFVLHLIKREAAGQGRRRLLERNSPTEK